MEKMESREQQLIELLNKMINSLKELIEKLQSQLNELKSVFQEMKYQDQPTEIIKLSLLLKLFICWHDHYQEIDRYYKNEYLQYRAKKHTLCLSFDFQLGHRLSEQADELNRIQDDIDKLVRDLAISEFSSSVIAGLENTVEQHNLDDVFSISHHVVNLLREIATEYQKLLNSSLSLSKGFNLQMFANELSGSNELYEILSSRCPTISPGLVSDSTAFIKMIEQTDKNFKTLNVMHWGNQLDVVQFRCAAPMVIKPGKYFTAKIMMFREDDPDRADREARLIDDKVRMASSDVIDAEQGQEFTLRLQSPDLPTLDEVRTLRWNGRYAARDFQILLPVDYDREQLRLLGRVYSDMTPLTDISLILEVCDPAPQEVICEKLRLRTAFISYASKDRAEVVKRIQGMQAARQDMDIFIDVESLRRGEEYEPRLYQEIRDRDLFYLFWSRNAAASDWVEKELTYALSHKPETQIEPISLEPPDICPPPEKLKHRHFRDWTLKYIT